MKRIRIINGRVWDGRRFQHADVMTEGSSIIKLGQGITDEADFVYDAAGKIVSAGLVDCHVHMRGISADDIGAAVEMISFPFGVTAAADASGDCGDGTLMDTFMVKSAVFVGVIVQEGQVDFAKTQQALNRYGTRTMGIKVMFDTKSTAGVDLPTLREICAFAHERGLRVMVHSTNSPVPMGQLSDALGRGDILTHAFHGGMNHATKEDFARMRDAQRRGVCLDIGFSGVTHADFSVLRGALEYGIVPDHISTDITKRSLFTRGGHYGLTMCMSIAKQLGMKEEDIFRGVTSNPAKALGKEGEWGVLKVGGVADIAVFDAHTSMFDLTDKTGTRVCGTEGYRCVLTVADGQVVYRG